MKREITAQFLYDLRELTGFISGTDLHQLFTKLVGDPAPKGRTPINLQDAMQACPKLVALLKEKNIAQRVKEYSDISLPASPPLGMMEHTVAAAWVENAMAVKVAQHG